MDWPRGSSNWDGSVGQSVRGGGGGAWDGRVGSGGYAMDCDGLPNRPAAAVVVVAAPAIDGEPPAAAVGQRLQSTSWRRRLAELGEDG